MPTDKGGAELRPSVLHTAALTCHVCRRSLLCAVLQLQYTWQALTLEGSPFKDDTTLSYVMDKLSSYNSLSSASLISSDDDLAEAAAAAAAAAEWMKETEE